MHQLYLVVVCLVCWFTCFLAYVYYHHASQCSENTQEDEKCEERLVPTTRMGISIPRCYEVPGAYGVYALPKARAVVPITVVVIVISHEGEQEGTQ